MIKRKQQILFAAARAVQPQKADEARELSVAGGLVAGWLVGGVRRVGTGSEGRQ